MYGVVSHIFHYKHLFLLALKQKFIRKMKYQANKH